MPRCPVCEGEGGWPVKGRVNKRWQELSDEYITCRVCNGNGGVSTWKRFTYWLNGFRWLFYLPRHLLDELKERNA